MKTFLFSLVALVFITESSLLAWHDGGHKTVAAIAFRRLNDAQKKAVYDLLKNHPRFDEEFTQKMPDGLSEDAAIEWAFQQAAVFPDIAKKYSGQLKSTFDRSIWHFVNFPEFLTPADRQAMHPENSLNLETEPPAELPNNANVVQVIKFSRKTIANSSVDKSKRALMLSWLFHTVGDIHQPLHSTALFSRGLFPDGDRGGNRVHVTPKGDLHTLWDDFPGGRLSFKSVQRQAARLLANNSLSNAGEEASTELNEKTWVDESKVLTMNLVYDDEVMAFLRNMEAESDDIEHQPINLSEDYLRAASAACDKRVVQAGFRLGAILSAIFD